MLADINFTTLPISIFFRLNSFPREFVVVGGDGGLKRALAQIDISEGRELCVKRTQKPQKKGLKTFICWCVVCVVAPRSIDEKTVGVRWRIW